MAKRNDRTQPCAEPDCPEIVGPRDASTAFLILHCEQHQGSQRVRDGQPTSAKWKRRTCTHCGVLYERYASQAIGRTTERAFCRATCRNAAGSKPRRGEHRTCERDGCDKPFYVPASSPRKFCDRTCKDLGSRTKVYLDFICKACDRPFQVAESQARWNKNDFCTRECSWTYSKFQVGDTKISADGYVMVYAPDHVMAQPSTGWVFEHRMVVSDIIGRPLLPSEEVHHRSGVRTVNTPDQLVLMSKSHPAGAGLRDTIDWCRKFIAENEPLAEKLEAAGVHTTLDTDDAVVALFGADQARVSS